ncbi:hypothetical protein DdX_11018 [Ditylenchus destructor]|uniref:Uncharacterized protein n=1 Tax=Ditylenchus destructor TaxID=166010 RepID=A0AAD4R533_9BILA|nr:hypothetical protein DdX_11018 [Ditylenchus destructor]
MLLNYATKTSALQRNGWRIAARAYSVDSPKEEATTSVAKRRGLGGVTMEEYEKIVAAREKHAPNKDGFREMKVDNQSIQWRFQHEHRKKRGMTKDHAYMIKFIIPLFIGLGVLVFTLVKTDILVNRRLEKSMNQFVKEKRPKELQEWIMNEDVQQQRLFQGKYLQDK